MITVPQLKTFAPQIKGSYDEMCAAINLSIEKAELNTVRRVRYFMTQTHHETRGYTKFDEDLFYLTPEALVRAFPTRMSMRQGDGAKGYAPEFLRNERKLANFVYANRYGNGGPETDDGYKFRGQGGIHTTFKDNFLACSKAMYGDDRLVKTPDLIQKYEAAMLSAAWYWNTRKLNPLADADEFTKVTTLIQGSAATVPQRLMVLNRANTIF